MTLTNPPSSLCDIRSWLYDVKDEVNSLENSILNTSYPQNRVYASPDGSAGLLSVRALVKNDLPATTWSTPNAIGSTTPAAGTFTTIVGQNITLNAAGLSNEGNIGYSTNRQNLTKYTAGKSAYIGALEARSLNNRTISSTAVATTMFGTSIDGSLTFPANYFTVGRILSFVFRGNTQSVNTTDTLTFAITVNGAGFFSSTAQARTTTLSRGFMLAFDVMCLSTGAGGTANIGMNYTENHQGYLPFRGDSTTGVGLNTTIANTFDVRAQWSASSASNIVAVYSGYVVSY